MEHSVSLRMSSLTKTYYDEKLLTQGYGCRSTIEHKSSLLERNKNYRLNCTPSVLLKQCNWNTRRQKDREKHSGQLRREHWESICKSNCIRQENCFPKTWGSTEQGKCRRAERRGDWSDWNSLYYFLPAVGTAKLSHLARHAAEQSKTSPWCLPPLLSNTTRLLGLMVWRGMQLSCKIWHAKLIFFRF